MVAELIVQDENSYTSNTTQFIIDVPSGGWQAGDVLQWSITLSANTARTFTLRNGTTSLSKTILQSGIALDSSYSEVAYYVIDSTPPSGALNVLVSATAQGTVAWTVVRGAKVGDPLNGFVISSSSGATPHTLPSLSTDEAYCLITGGIIQGSGSATWTPPSPWTIGADGTRRNGIVAYKGLQDEVGTTGSSSWVMPDGLNALARIYQAAWNSEEPPEPPEPPLQATIVSEPWPSASGDVADGAAIIPDPVDPGNSVWIGTNKDSTGGLAVYDMDGHILSRVTGFGANSVDWRDTTGLSGWDGRILVMTTNRNSGSFGLRFYWFNRTTRTLTFANQVNLTYEPYGTTLGFSGDLLVARVSERGSDDASPRNMYQHTLTRSGDTISIGSPTRTLTTPSVIEGMSSNEFGWWYVSQEDVGLYELGPFDSWTDRVTIDTVDANLVADIEDNVFINFGSGKLLVSSQGDNSYHVYGWTGSAWAHEQRFQITKPGGTGLVRGTDGLDAYVGNLGPNFPYGALIVHDETQDPSRFVMLPAEEIWPELDVLEPISIPTYRGSRDVTELFVGAGSVFDLYVGTP